MIITSTINPLSASDGHLPVSIFCYKDEKRFLRFLTAMRQDSDFDWSLHLTRMLNSPNLGNHRKSREQLSNSTWPYYCPANILLHSLSRDSCRDRQQRLSAPLDAHQRAAAPLVITV
jgi:hypothetical protein